jgi:hypothetical protein
MLDALRSGTLNEAQQEIVRALRSAILAVDARRVPGDDEKVVSGCKAV